MKWTSLTLSEAVVPQEPADRLQSSLERGIRAERSLVLALVVFLHLALFALLLLARFSPTAPTPERLLQVTIGGPVSRGVRPPLEKVTFLDPKTLQLTEPLDELAVDAGSLGGSANVTRPAEAIAERHEFPRLSSNDSATRQIVVRLLLSITGDGAVADAVVTSTSGTPSLDAFAIAWVKERWRYRPALQNGVPIAVTTMAIVQFL